MDPFDSKVPQKPVPSNKPFPGRDNYIEPWDTRTQPRDVKSKHKDDYKDPWDSKPSASLPKSSFEEDEDYNYTVPYDDAGIHSYLYPRGYLTREVAGVCGKSPHTLYPVT